MDALLLALFMITKCRTKVHHVLNVVSLDWMPQMFVFTDEFVVCLESLHAVNTVIQI